MLTPDFDTKTLIGPDAPIFASLQYDLKVALKSSTARIVSCFRLSNPHLNDQFQRLSQDSLTLQTWIDSTCLTGANTEEDVFRRGFQIVTPQKGLCFTVGSFSPSTSGQIHKALVCEILIGRSYTIDKASVEDTELPSGYKSFCIQGPEDSKDLAQDYFVKNAAHILPKYVIQYEYDQVLEVSSRQKHKCDDCEIEIAMVYCEADKAYLCKNCDLNLHQTKISKLHTRKPIGEGISVFGVCKYHTTRQVQYFCTQCHEPVCIDCTIMGSHAKSEEGKHVLVSVEDYFKTVLEESRLLNPHLQERKTAINDQINNIQSRADAVVEMGNQITGQIDAGCAKSKQQCKNIIEQKLTVLMGDEQELRRQLGDVDRLEDFLKYQQEGDSMNCVSTWHLHQMCREKLCDFEFFRQEIDVQLDAKINGNISVIVDEGPARKTSVVQQPSSPVRNSSPKRPESPMIQESYSRGATAVYLPAPSAPALYGILNQKNLPKKFATGERKIGRRTSDFFHEALSFGNDGDDDFDSYSQIS